MEWQLSVCFSLNDSGETVDPPITVALIIRQQIVLESSERYVLKVAELQNGP